MWKLRKRDILITLRRKISTLVTTWSESNENTAKIRGTADEEDLRSTNSAVETEGQHFDQTETCQWKEAYTPSGEK